jgi:hypothetical protein
MAHQGAEQSRTESAMRESEGVLPVSDRSTACYCYRSVRADIGVDDQSSSVSDGMQSGGQIRSPLL